MAIHADFYFAFIPLGSLLTTSTDITYVNAKILSTFVRE